MVGSNAALAIEEGDADDAELMEAEEDEERAADAGQPVAVAGDDGGGGDEGAGGPEGDAEGDEDEGEAEDVGDGVGEDAAAVDAVDAGRGGRGEVGQEDGDERQHARGGDGEHNRKKGRQKGDIDADEGNHTIGAPGLQLTL